MSAITAFKGFNNDWTCRGHQYEVGQTYETDGPVEQCRSGFHACETAIDVLGYYGPAESRFAEVLLEGKLDRNGSRDSKIAAAKITVVAELSMPDFIDRAVKQIVAMAKGTKKESGNRSAATNMGDLSAATNTGNRSAATNMGDGSAATNTGYQSAATNTGYQSAATNTGNGSAASVGGKASTAVSTGEDGKVMSECEGCSLFANEMVWNGSEHEIKSNACGITGRDGIEPGVWYVAKGGRLVEAVQ